MVSIVDMLRTEGIEMGKAEGSVRTILDLVEDGSLTVAQAKRKLSDLKQKGLLNAAAQTAALERLKGSQ